jgi:hypothetical protein
MWHHHGYCVEVKFKTDGSIRPAALDPVTLVLLFSFYYAVGALSYFSLLFGHINITLEG